MTVDWLRFVDRGWGLLPRVDWLRVILRSSLWVERLRL